jgi:hypothetical protein
MQVLRDGHRPTISGGPVISGNYMNLCDEPVKEIRRIGKHRLVEECEEVTIRAVQKLVGKKTLLAAIRQNRPVLMPVLGGVFELWLIDQPHRLPGRLRRQSPLAISNCRIWIQCPCCRRVVGKLYFYYLAPDSLALSDLLCRTCLGLVYRSQNCGDNRWYKEVARPLKRLLSEKRKLLSRPPNPRVMIRLTEIDGEVCTLTQKLQPKAKRRSKVPRRPASGQRRPYRDISLLGIFSTRDRINMQPDRSSADSNVVLASTKDA